MLVNVQEIKWPENDLRRDGFSSAGGM